MKPANMSAMPPAANRRTRSEATMTCCGWRRSAQTPPKSVQASRATIDAAMTRPRSPGPPPAWTTATASATVWKPLPTQDRVWPVASSRKSEMRMTEKLVHRLTISNLKIRRWHNGLMAGDDDQQQDSVDHRVTRWAAFWKNEPAFAPE